MNDTPRRTRLRWRLASLLNRLPGQCWSDLVSFALGYHCSPWQPVTSTCRRDLNRNGSCYCGKLRVPAAAAGPGTDGGDQA